MTDRARWLVFLALVGFFAGAFRGQIMLALVSLSTLAWVLVEWFRFQARIRGELPRMRFARSVNGREELSGSLWAGRKIRIVVRIQSRSKISPVIQIRDVVPDILEVLAPPDQDATRKAGSMRASSRLDKAVALDNLPRWRRWFAAESHRDPASPKLPNEWTLESPCKEEVFSYVATARAAGHVTLPGVRLTLEDPYRFFLLHRFMELPQTFRILPDYFQSGERRPTVKRHNSLPRHGIHRLQRAGAGSELLELREYASGDPPKSIAWKVSARRGKLMTRKYESEVPVRVHLLVDGSVSTRLGGYGLRLLDQINYVAASVAKAATSAGDPVSGMLVDETGVKRLRWLSGDRGFLQLLQALADFAHHPPPATENVTPYMNQCALRICHERFPELLDRRYHRIPFSFLAARRQRLLMAGVLAEVFRLSPRQQVECYCDNASMAIYLQEFLSRAGMPWMPPLLSTVVNPAATGTRSMALLGKAMSRAIANARDNEVFVLLADPLSCSPNLARLVRVLKLALAKHHRVAFVCPTTTFQRPTSEPIRPRSDDIQDLLLASEQTRIRELAFEMKRELIRLGVAVSFSGERDAIQMVMAEMDMARDGRTRLQGIRS